VGLRLEFGKIQSILKPGLHSFNPCTEKIIVIDMRTQIIDLGLQTLLTRDSVTVFVDAFVNYSVTDPIKAKFMVQDYKRLITFFAQGVMKNIIAQHTLTDILNNRLEIESQLTKLIDKQTVVYGLKVYSIETQRIQLPQSMDRAMAISAET
jgi:regulator of protease activity HflC (stomatin/prohibitin superfamily)